jgi:hypothetical protein
MFSIVPLTRLLGDRLLPFLALAGKVYDEFDGIGESAKCPEVSRDVQKSFAPFSAKVRRSLFRFRRERH